MNEKLIKAAQTADLLRQDLLEIRSEFGFANSALVVDEMVDQIARIQNQLELLSQK